MKVCKFGGSSLSDAAQFEKVKKIVESDKQRVYVVPSAPGKVDANGSKVTDMLVAYHKAAAAGDDTSQIFQEISERFVSIKDCLNLRVDILAHLKRIDENVKKGAGIDYTISRGEYLSAILLAELLGFDFIDSCECVMFSMDGKYESEKTRTVMRGRLRNHCKAVIPGFYGSMPNGQIKTFPRGGSDITGAIVARAARADVYENWTDVSGALMADPRIVDCPRVIRKITYRELRELAYMGATVLHEDAIYPVSKANIPINIKNTNDPKDAGTFIVPNVTDNDTDTITGIAGKKGFTVIAVEKANMNTELGFGRRMLTALENNDVRFEHMPSGIDSLGIVLADSEIEGKQTKLLDDVYKMCEPDSLEVYSGLALIATVGRGMIRKVGVAARLFAALAQSNINVRMINQGSSEINIIVGVDEYDFEIAIKAIYNEFCK